MVSSDKNKFYPRHILHEKMHFTREITGLDPKSDVSKNKIV